MILLQDYKITIQYKVCIENALYFIFDIQQQHERFSCDQQHSDLL